MTGRIAKVNRKLFLESDKMMGWIKLDVLSFSENDDLGIVGEDQLIMLRDLINEILGEEYNNTDNL